MPRRKRSYLPGGAFHVTARTHCQEFWFEDLRDEIVDIIGAALDRTDTRLLAFGIMTNHFHLVVQQGIAPLSQLMHPVCQRTAYAVHRRFARAGYVMGYRYHDTPCRSEAHLRNAILYTHRNPVAAGMCENVSDYRWTSDLAYRSETLGDARLAGLQPAIQLFRSGLPDRTPQQDYADFYAWYDACKNLGAEPLPYSPGVTVDDVYWLENFSVAPSNDRRPRSDLRDVVLRALSELAPDLTLAEIRNGVRTRAAVAMRDAVVERALFAGHRPIDVARFLNLSDTTVSRINVRLRLVARA